MLFVLSRLSVGSSFDNVARWHLINDDTYKISLEYEAGGVGRTLFDDIYVRLECDPQSLAFLI